MSRKVTKSIQMPHAYVIMMALIILSAVLTWIMPAGNFERVFSEELGRSLVVPGSFQFAESSPVGIWKLFLCIYNGFVNAGDTIFFLLFACGYVTLLMKTGTMNAMVGALLRKIGNKDYLLIPVFFTIFAIGGTSFGMNEEAWGFIPVFVSIALTLGYDRLVGAAIVTVGTGVGFAAAILNPFTVGLASSIAEIPIISPKITAFRILSFVLFTALSVAYIMRYALKVKKDPAKSVLYGVKEEAPLVDKNDILKIEFTSTQKLTLAGFGALIVAIVIGVSKFHFYLAELAAMFLIAMLLTGIINRMSPNEIAESFVESSKSMVFTILMIGFARAIQMIMTEGNIIDTAVLYLSNAVQSLPSSLAAVGMLIAQNLINFFIPSGTGQAVVVMPIMAPLADVVGVSRELAVLAYQFGDGFSNLFWPTGCAMICAAMGIGMDRWYKFIVKLFGMMFALQVVLITVASLIGI